MSEIVSYKCPSCNAPLRFDGKSQELVCDYCGKTYAVSEIETKKKETPKGEGWDTSSLKTEWGKDGEHIAIYNCPSCGAELLTEETTAAASCPYCGNPTVVSKNISGIFKPDYIIPFKLNIESAKSSLRNYYEGKKLLPPVFRDENKINEVKGIYVPFWLFNGEAEAEASYKCTRSRMYVSGDYEVTETDHYDVYRKGNMEFEKIPVDASKKMPDEYMDSVEPFNYSQLKEFSTAFLPGFLADKYDMSVEDCSKRADNRATNTTLYALGRSVNGYDTVSTERTRVEIKRGEVYYALFPIFILNTSWKGKKYLFAMNGQTGKFIGKLPISQKKYLMYFAMHFVMGASVVGAILYLFYDFIAGFF